ncbi:hypothetical protein BUALT_Bualt18G0104400 [Buddleja alternifolia]|uniref:Uncharacterized protein n=1 Tax=Buddleja alternifolia TaxID=168488 RepID=A0AAV6W5P4_9LAMI|nr:hypothetical protein BUALT_Bualt18G0104400 [Buddleja alternifolia]
MCTCFPEFEPISNGEWDEGNWTMLQCGRKIFGGKEDGFLKMSRVKLPDKSKWFPMFETECRNECLNNCTCMAYAYYDGVGCMMWDEGLIDVQKFTSDGADLYIRLVDSELDNETLVSNGQKFKLGFFSPGNSSYRYVGIMYNLPVMTVIWVANRENPINDSSGIMEISGDGNLVISDGQNSVVWSSNISTYVANSSAQILDTGNLVLYNSNGGIIWESFLHVSDSFVEGVKTFTNLSTKERSIMTSWRSSNDPGPGRITCSIEPSPISQLFVWKDGYPYWRSGPWNGQAFNGVPRMKSFYYWRRRGVIRFGIGR